MQLIAGRTAQEFNQRKDRNRAYWEDRYHATTVAADGLRQRYSLIDLGALIKLQIIESVEQLKTERKTWVDTAREFTLLP